MEKCTFRFSRLTVSNVTTPRVLEQLGVFKDDLRPFTFRLCDFFETGEGNCRLKSRLCSQLSETAPTWGKLVAPWAEYVTRSLWTGVKSGRNPFPPTRLTQQRRIQSKGKAVKVSVNHPKADHLCSGCGKTITTGRTNCGDCAISGATERLLNAANLGRVAARKPEARAKHAASRRRHAKACSEWDASTQPDWLTAQAYSEKIQPLLVRKSSSDIAKHIGVSRWYAGRIREGYRPHPRHWEALAALAGLTF
jgi:hypothetical protein